MTDTTATRPALPAPRPRERTLFAYGILRSRETVANVLERPYDGTMYDAVLPDHTVARDMGPAYAIPSPGDAAEGVLLTGLTDADFDPLDHIESTSSRHYDRVACTVLVGERLVETEYYRAGPSAQATYAARKRRLEDSAGWSTYNEDDEGMPNAWYQRRAAVQPDDTAEYAEWLQRVAAGDPDALATADAADFEALAAWELGEIADSERFSAPAAPVAVAAPSVAALPKHPPYPGTPEHLPARRGIPLAEAKRSGARPKGATLRLFACDSLRSLDRIELIINREWFGSRKPAELAGMRLTQSFPPFLVADKSEGAAAHGHLISGLTADDFEALDNYMNVESGYQRRVTAEFGSVPAFIYVMGDKGPAILKQAKERRGLARKARKAAAKQRAVARKADAAAKRAPAKPASVPTGAGIASVKYPNWYEDHRSNSTSTRRSGDPSRSSHTLTSWSPSR